MSDDGTPRPAEGGADLEPTPEQRADVAAAVAAGLQPDQVALAVGISLRVLAQHFPDELANGATRANFAVAQALHRAATDEKGGRDSTIAGMFWLKCRAGWEERPRSAAGEE